MKFAAILLLLVVSVRSMQAQEGCDDVNLVIFGGFVYVLCDVPDIDQKRATSDDGTIDGLPWNGAPWCVPTATMNVLAYLANHGFPGLGPGFQPYNWAGTNTSTYNEMTYNLNLLGYMMETNDSGTGSHKAGPAIEQWMSMYGQEGEFLVSFYGAKGTALGNPPWSPRLIDMALAALDGAYVLVAVGWYTNADNDLPKEREGGHHVTLVGASGGLNDSSQAMVIHNPSSAGSMTTQAEFHRRWITTEDRTGTFEGVLFTKTRTVDFNSGYLDGYQTIRPKWALVWNELAKLVALCPRCVASEKVLKSHAPAGRVADLAVHRHGVKHPYLVEGSDTIWQLDTLTGESTILAEVSSPKAIELGGAEMSVYVLTRHQIVALGWDGREKRRIQLPESVDQIAWDEKNKQLLALSLRSRRLLQYDIDLALVGSMSVPAIPGDGRVHMSVDPRRGVVWMLREGASSVLRIDRTSALVPLEGVRRAQSLGVGDDGSVYVSEADQILAFDTQGRRDRRSAFNGMPGGPVIDLARSFSNFDPAFHTGPGWHDVPPPEE